MRALILAAGRGRRLPSYLSKKPKVLLNINKKSILDKLIKNFQSVGINKIALITGFNRNSLKKYKLKKFHNKKWSKTNMVYSLCKADSWLKKYSCIVSYGDIIYEAKALKKLCKNKNNITLSYDINWKKLWKMRFENPLNDAETFKIKKNLVKDIGKKTTNILDIQGQYMGLIKFTPKGWGQFKDCLSREFNGNYEKIYLTDVFQKLIEKKSNINGLKYTGKWAEIDSLKDYMVMKKIFKS
jgi:choline kinase